jgi:hypothetical protein
VCHSDGVPSLLGSPLSGKQELHLGQDYAMRASSARQSSWWPMCRTWSLILMISAHST